MLGKVKCSAQTSNEKRVKGDDDDSVDGIGPTTSSLVLVKVLLGTGMHDTKSDRKMQIAKCRE